MILIESYLTGSFPFVIWSNGEKNIKIVFDFTDEDPMHIFVYDSDDIAMYSYREFYEEFKFKPKSKKDIDGYIEYAAQKFHEMLKQDVVI